LELKGLRLTPIENFRRNKSGKKKNSAGSRKLKDALNYVF